MDKFITKKVMPVVRLIICAGVCVGAAKLCDSILDDEETKVVVKKITKAAEITRYIAGATTILNDK